MLRDFNLRTASTLIGLAERLERGELQAYNVELSPDGEEPGEFIVKFYTSNPCKFYADLS